MGLNFLLRFVIATTHDKDNDVYGSVYHHMGRELSDCAEAKLINPESHGRDDEEQGATKCCQRCLRSYSQDTVLTAEGIRSSEERWCRYH